MEKDTILLRISYIISKYIIPRRVWFNKVIIITSQTKISEGYSTVLPAEIRKTLNLTPGDILQWYIDNNTIIIKPRKRVTLSDILVL